MDDLIEEGFVRRHGETEWSGGRRRPLLEFNADGYVVLGVDMGGTKLYGTISEIGGNIIDEVYLERQGASGEEYYDLLTKLIDALLAWDEFFYALIFTCTLTAKTIPVAIAEFIGRYVVNVNGMMAGGILAAVPPVLVALIFQRYIVSGMTAGAVKG